MATSADISLRLFGTRYYASAKGCFTSNVGDPDTSNMYNYVYPRRVSPLPGRIMLSSVMILLPRGNGSWPLHLSS